jgi:hypothetical protein
MTMQGEGHNRSSTAGGPDYCDECSRAAQDLIKWPCAEAPVTVRRDDLQTVLNWLDEYEWPDAYEAKQRLQAALNAQGR